MALIVLSTINARYVHAALGLRYLAANMGELAHETRISEFVLGARPVDMVETILADKPRIVGFGVYIWNVEETTRVVAMLKRVAPEIVVVVGGPEVSHEVEEQRICILADYVITGWGDVSFPMLCRSVLQDISHPQKIIAGVQPPLNAITLPYSHYGDEDIEKRFLYVEASRGCPYKCEFCLSALDRTAWAFDIDEFLAEVEALYVRGARHFRFVDRTFNLKVASSCRILEFFLERLDERLFLHFEVIPDHLPEKLKEAIKRFPPGSLQFEVGIQTWNPEVQALISRRQDNQRAEENLRWLRENSQALIHVDLIAGLPGEDLHSFGRGFDRLYTLRPHEIQVGILKRLRGTAIARHTEGCGMRYNPDPPYNVLATSCVPFPDMQRISRFARYWELVGNSGRFKRTLAMMVGEPGSGDAFERFMRFSDWLFATTRKTHEIALERLAALIQQFLVSELHVDAGRGAEMLQRDYEESGAKGRLALVGSRQDAPTAATIRRRLRQSRHINGMRSTS